MQNKISNPVSEESIIYVYELIQNADAGIDACTLLFKHLGFIESSKENYRPFSFIRRLRITKRLGLFIRSARENEAVKMIKRFTLSPQGVVVSSIVAAIFGYLTAYFLSDRKSLLTPISAGSSIGTLILAIFAFVVGYRRWELAESNRNVDDAHTRKALANKMMVDNAEVLRPYVENVFNIEYKYNNNVLSDDDRLKIQMYVYTEIDNLEYVFDKSRSGLIKHNYYVLRPIKIFLARCENSYFEREARKLIRKGAYNREFVKCVETLLDVGLWSRTRCPH